MKLPLIGIVAMIGVLCAPPVEAATTATPKVTPTPTPRRGERGDLRERRQREDWDKDEKKVFGEYEGTKKSYSLEAIRKEDGALKVSDRLLVYPFDTDKTGLLPAGFTVATTEGQALGNWRVETSYEATTGSQIVAQRDASKADRFSALLLSETPSAGRIDVTTRVWIEPDGREQTAGLLVGSPGTAEGYALLLDARAGTVSAQRVVAGKGTILKNEDVVRETLKELHEVESSRWHHLKLEFHSEGGSRSRVVGYLEGVKMVEARDNVYLDPGKIGLVTKGTTRARFDTMTVSVPKDWTGVVATPTKIGDAPLHSGESGGICQQSWEWNFDEAEADTAPVGFTSVALGEGAEGEWQTVADDRSNPRNLAQLSRIENKNRFNGLLLDGRILADGEVSVRLRTKSGKSDHRLAGIVFRQKDARTYYYAGIHTGSDRLLLLRVANGREQVIGAAKVELKNNSWHTLKVTMDGTLIRVSLDGEARFASPDNSIEAGAVGLLTQSNTNAQFDDLSACSYRSD